MLPFVVVKHATLMLRVCAAGKPALRRGSTFTFRPPDHTANVPQQTDISVRNSSLRRTISVPVTSTSRDTAPLAFHAKVHGASRAAVAGALTCHPFTQVPDDLDAVHSCRGVVLTGLHPELHLFTSWCSKCVSEVADSTLKEQLALGNGLSNCVVHIPNPCSDCCGSSLQHLDSGIVARHGAFCHAARDCDVSVCSAAPSLGAIAEHEHIAAHPGSPPSRAYTPFPATTGKNAYMHAHICIFIQQNNLIAALNTRFSTAILGSNNIRKPGKQ